MVTKTDTAISFLHTGTGDFCWEGENVDGPLQRVCIFPPMLRGNKMAMRVIYTARHLSLLSRRDWPRLI